MNNRALLVTQFFSLLHHIWEINILFNCRQASSIEDYMRREEKKVDVGFLLKIINHRERRGKDIKQVENK